MPVTSALLDQAHHAIDRKLFRMKGFHHPKGSQQAFLTGLAHLYNLVPYQRRAQHAANVAWKLKEARSQHKTGSSICVRHEAQWCNGWKTPSPVQAGDEPLGRSIRGCTLR